MAAGSRKANGGMKLPSFFVVGAQKAGTSSLHDRLRNLPSVRLPALKETHFFSNDEQYARGVQWYLRQFPEISPDSVLGEVAPDYLFAPRAAGRIRELIARPQLIFIFREPIERAYSNYLMSVRKGYEKLPFAEALVEESTRLEDENGRKFLSYFSRSLYVEQVERYLALFPKEDMLFLKFEDLVDKGHIGRQTFRELADFIGIRVKPDQEGELTKANPASQPRSLLVRNLLYGSSSVKKLFRFLIPSRDLRAAIAHRVDLLNLKPASKSEIGAIPAAISRRARQEVSRLQEMTGLGLEDWLGQIAAYDIEAKQTNSE